MLRAKTVNKKKLFDNAEQWDLKIYNVGQFVERNCQVLPNSSEVRWKKSDRVADTTAYYIYTFSIFFLEGIHFRQPTWKQIFNFLVNILELTHEKGLKKVLIQQVWVLLLANTEISSYFP